MWSGYKLLSLKKCPLSEASDTRYCPPLMGVGPAGGFGTAPKGMDLTVLRATRQAGKR
jgi:hypothetical protein